MRRPPSNAGVGASSIMLIIVVLCLTLFGVLSLVTAQNDLKLTERTFVSVQDYYNADAAAQRTLRSVDEWIAGGMQGEIEGVSLVDNGDGTHSCKLSLDGLHTLELRLRLSAEGYVIEGYRYENTADWTADTTEELFG